MDTITLETHIAYPARRRAPKADDEQPRIVFIIPTHSDLLPFMQAPPPRTVSCYYRNLKFKYGTLTRGTPIRLTADIELGTRGGVTLHIRHLELTGPTAPDLTKVGAKMMKTWTLQFEKQNASP